MPYFLKSVSYLSRICYCTWYPGERDGPSQTLSLRTGLEIGDLYTESNRFAQQNNILLQSVTRSVGMVTQRDGRTFQVSCLLL